MGLLRRPNLPLARLLKHHVPLVPLVSYPDLALLEFLEFLVDLVLQVLPLVLLIPEVQPILVALVRQLIPVDPTLQSNLVDHMDLHCPVGQPILVDLEVPCYQYLI